MSTVPFECFQFSGLRVLYNNDIMKRCFMAHFEETISSVVNNTQNDKKKI